LRGAGQGGGCSLLLLFCSIYGGRCVHHNTHHVVAMFASTRAAAAVNRLITTRRGFAAAAAAAAASVLELARLHKPTRREFLKFRREQPGCPFVIFGALDDLGWKLSQWTPKDVRDRFGDVEVPLEVRGSYRPCRAPPHPRLSGALHRRMLCQTKQFSHFHFYPLCFVSPPPIAG
jgi:hypothetical protein